MKIQNFVFLFCLLSFSINSFPQQTWPNRLRVNFNTATNGNIDNVVIRFSSDPTVTTQESFYWDARSLNCCTFIASRKGDTKFAIQTRPLNFGKDTVKLTVESTTYGNFKLVFTEYQTFMQASKILLLDAYTGVVQEIKSNPSYDFTINSNAASQGADRFKLVFVSEQLVIECPNNMVINNAFGRNGANVMFTVYAPISKCSNPFINFSNIPGSFFPIGNTTVNIDAYDLCGNTYNCSFVITVKDIEPPMIVTPLPVNNATDAGSAVNSFIPTQPITTDNSGNFVIASVRSDNEAIAAPYPIGRTVITWTATDEAGNRTSVNQFINVTDTEQPIITAPVIKMNTGSASCSVKIADYLLSVHDNSGNVSYTAKRSDGADLGAPYFPGSTSVIWTAADAAGNTATAVQVITVEDKEPPVIVPAIVAGLTANAQGCKYLITGTGLDATASDNCSGVILKNSINNAGSLNGVRFAVGTTSVTWTATDAAGNTATAVQVITIEDKESPVIVPAIVAVLTANAQGCKYLVTGTGLDATASDNCSGVILKNSINNEGSLNGVSFAVGTTSVTWTATDAAGNTSSFMQTITVNAPLGNISISDAFTMLTGVQANTLYMGYPTASQLSYTASTTIPGLSYNWTASTGLIITQTSNPATIKLSAASSAQANVYVLTLTITNATGCKIVVTKQIKIIDIRCGAKLDKISMCTPTGSEVCVNVNTVTANLKKGYQLGSCYTTGAKAAAVSVAAVLVKEPVINVYPNPSKGLFQIQMENYENQNAELKIIDLFGKPVLQQTVRIQSLSERLQINIQHVASGIYTAQLITKEGIKSIRLVIAK